MTIMSEKTGKKYNTVEECLADEKRYDEKIAIEEAKKKELSDARKDRAKEVEDAYKKRIEADKNYRTLLNKFIDDYGSFHMTLDTELEDSFNLLDFLDNFWF